MTNLLKNIAAAIITRRLMKHLQTNVEAPELRGRPIKMWLLLSLTDQLGQRSVLIKTRHIGSLQSLQLEYQLRPGDVIVPDSPPLDDTRVLVVNVMSNDSFDGVAVGSSGVVAFENKSGSYYVIQTNACNVYML